MKQNRYSVPSCFIGHRIQVRVFADTIELWHAGKKQFAMPRMIGKGMEFIDFRHVIDSLVRKPGAFANYRTTVPATAADDVNVEVPDLESYDNLLEHKEVLDDPTRTTTPFEQDDSSTAALGTGFPFETTSSANDSSDGEKPVGTSSSGGMDPLAISGRANDARMRDATLEPHRASPETIGVGADQDVGSDRLETSPVDGTPTHGPTAKRRVFEGSLQPVDFRPPGVRQNSDTKRVGGILGSIGPYGVQGNVCESCTASVACQEGAAASATPVQAWDVLSVDHRRHWIRTTDARRDGGSLYIDCESLRKVEHSAQQQPSIFEMGTDIQGSDDDRSSDRPLGSSQHDIRAECTELSTGRSEQGTFQFIASYLDLNGWFSTGEI